MAEAPKTISTRAEFDALEVGTAFFEEGNPKPNGEPWVKTAPRPKEPGRFRSLMDAPQEFLQETLPGMTDRMFNMGIPGGDKLRAAWQVPMGYGGYQENLANIRGDTAKFKEEHPVASLAGDVIGGLGFGAGATALGSRVAKAIPGYMAASTGRSSRYGRNVAGGLTTGSLYGAGESEPGEELRGAAFGGTIGGGIAAAIPGIGLAAGPLARSAQGRFDSRTGALRRMNEASAAHGITPQRWRQRDANQGPGSVLADTGGEASRWIANQGQAHAGKAATRAEMILGARTAAEGGRISQSLRTNLNADDWYKQQNTLIADLQKGSKTYYDAAYDALKQIDDPAVLAELRTVAGSEAMIKAVRDFGNAGGPLGVGMTVKEVNAGRSG